MFADNEAIVQIKWCNFKSDFTDEFTSLLQTGELSDIHIEMMDGSKICAHKIILRNGSEYFRDFFNVRPRSQFKKLSIDAVAAKFAIWFMYHGEINIPKTDLGEFLKAAKLLRLRGFETLRESDLSTKRDFKIDLGHRIDDNSDSVEKHDSKDIVASHNYSIHIDFNEYRKTPSWSDGQSSPEIVE